MAGGGMGGVSSTGYGQQSAQPNFGSNIDPNNIDPNHIFTDDFGRNNAAATPSNGQVAPTPTTDLNGMRNLLGGMSRTTGQSPFTADAKPNPFLSTPAPPGATTGPNLLSLLAPPGPVTSPNGVQGLFGNDPGFNSQFYLQQNPDVAKSEMYGSNPYQHYLDWGKAEGRVGNFDPNFYLQQNPDVAKAGVDPYQHYLQYGQKEGRAAYNTAAPAIQQQYSQAYTPTTTSWAAPTQQQTFNTPTVSQSGGTGGAVNYQYRRGGILSIR